MRLAQPIAANLFFLLASAGFGSLLRPLIPAGYAVVDRAAIFLLGGLGIFGTVLFCAGQVLISRSTVVGLEILGILVGARGLKDEFRQLLTLLSARPPTLPAVILSLVLLVTAIGGLALPTGDMNNDAIAYHYLGPTVWLRHEVIRPVPDETLSYFPVLVESDFAALLATGGRRAPNLFAVLSLGGLLLISGAIAVRLGSGRKGAWWTATLLAAMPAVYAGATGGFVDSLFAAFVLAAARIALDGGENGEVLLLGTFCGFAMATKYQGIIGTAAIMLLRMWVAGRRRKTRNPRLAKLVFAVSVAVAVAAPFYLRNWILYGCPIYPPPPLLAGLFPRTSVSPNVLAEVMKNVRETGAGMGSGLAHFLLLPFNLTYHTANFRGAGGIGLTAWCLAPFGWWARRHDEKATGLALFVVLSVAAWFVTAQVSRYLIAVYAVITIFGVLEWEGMSQERERFRFGSLLRATVIAISIGYGLYFLIPSRIADMRAAISENFEWERERRETRYEASFAYLNQEQDVKKVLILNGHVAAYFLDKEYVKPFGRWGEQTLAGVETSTQAVARVRSLGTTHVLDTRFPTGSYQLPESPAGLQLVFEAEDQRVFRVK